MMVLAWVVLLGGDVVVLCFVVFVGVADSMCILVLVLVWIGAWWSLVEML